MKKSLLMLTALSLTGWLTGCATMSVQECQVADWQTVGYRDGKAGRDLDYLLNHAKACGKASVTPDKTAWEQGRQQGLSVYCTADNAFALGKSGSKLNYVCPTERIPQLQSYNEQGLTIYRLQQAIDSDKQEREKLLEQYQKLRNGDNLDFKTEKEARIYLSELPFNINRLTDRINENQAVLNRLDY